MPEAPLWRIRSQLRWGKDLGSIQLDPISRPRQEARRTSPMLPRHPPPGARQRKKKEGWRTQELIEEQTSHDSGRTPTRYSLDGDLCLLLRSQDPPRRLPLPWLSAFRIGGIVPFLYSMCVCVCVSGLLAVFWACCRSYTERYWQHFWWYSIKAIFPLAHLLFF